MFTTIELFAGAGGLALGIEKAGFKTLALNEFNADACATLRKNRPNWNVIEGDVAEISGLDRFIIRWSTLSSFFLCR